MPEDLYIIQTTVPDELAQALKAHAALNSKLLLDIFVEAIERFIGRWHALHKKNHSVPYLISPRGSKPFNIRIPEKLAKRMQRLADEDHMPVRRFGYTALVHYGVGEKLIPAVGPVQSRIVVEHDDEPSIVDVVLAARRKRQRQQE